MSKINRTKNLQAIQAIIKGDIEEAKEILQPFDWILFMAGMTDEDILRLLHVQGRMHDNDPDLPEYFELLSPVKGFEHMTKIKIR